MRSTLWISATTVRLAWYCTLRKFQWYNKASLGELLVVPSEILDNLCVHIEEVRNCSRLVVTPIHGGRATWWAKDIPHFYLLECACKRKSKVLLQSIRDKNLKRPLLFLSDQSQFIPDITSNFPVLCTDMRDIFPVLTWQFISGYRVSIYGNSVICLPRSCQQNLDQICTFARTRIFNVERCATFTILVWW